MKYNTLEFVCTGMEDGGRFPLQNTGRGPDLSPEFVLKNLTPAARTLAITLEDLSHPIRNFTHWLIWNLPAATRVQSGIPAGKRVPGGACQGIGYGLHRYAGPKPPRGKTHRYRFTVYALDGELQLPPCAWKGLFLKRAEGHILQTGRITAEFE